jgi:DNA-binding CsgD family transcriptional regulator/PAS domain-containing protein
MLQDLYDAIEDDEVLENFASAVAKFCRARSANLIYAPPGAPAFQQMSYFPAQYIPLYLENFRNKDPWLRTAQMIPVHGQAISMDDYWPPEKFVETEMYNELLKPLGDDTGRCMGIEGVAAGAHLHIAVHRPLSGREFSIADKRRLQEAFAHVGKVLHLRGQLEGERTLRRRTERMMEAAGAAVLIVDRQMRILAASPAAIRYLEDRDGLTYEQGRFGFARRSTGDKVRQSCLDLINRLPATPMSFLVERPSGRPSYRLFLSMAENDPAAGVAIVIDDPCSSLRCTRLALLADAYRLTPAETLVVELLVQGHRIETIAAARNVSVETVRTQIKSIFVKTGVKRQAELLALLT